MYNIVFLSLEFDVRMFPDIIELALRKKFLNLASYCRKLFNVLCEQSNILYLPYYAS